MRIQVEFDVPNNTLARCLTEGVVALAERCGAAVMDITVDPVRAVANPNEETS